MRGDTVSDIVVSNLSKSYDGKPVLRDFNAVFRAGRITTIMGESGCGKTTLLNILLGLISPDSGSVTGLPKRVSAVFQEDRLCDDFTALSNVLMVTGNSGRARGQRLLAELGLGDELRTRARELSGGMRRRVAIARALVYDAELLILDEGFKGLDGATRAVVIDAIKHHCAGKTVISVTHAPEEAELLGGEVLRMTRLAARSE